MTIKVNQTSTRSRATNVQELEAVFVKKKLDDIWGEQVQSKFGFKKYEELRQALRELSQ